MWYWRETGIGQTRTATLRYECALHVATNCQSSNICVCTGATMSTKLFVHAGLTDLVVKHFGCHTRAFATSALRSQRRSVPCRIGCMSVVRFSTRSDGGRGGALSALHTTNRFQRFHHVAQPNSMQERGGGGGGGGGEDTWKYPTMGNRRGKPGTQRQEEAYLWLAKSGCGRTSRNRRAAGSRTTRPRRLLFSSSPPYSCRLAASRGENSS